MSKVNVAVLLCFIVFCCCFVATPLQVSACNESDEDGQRGACVCKYIFP